MNKKLTSAIVGGVVLISGFGVADTQINPYTDKGATFEIKSQSVVANAGEDKIELSKAEPSVTFSKWNGEASMTVKYDDVNATGDRPLMSDQVEYKDEKQEVHMYPLQAKVGMEDGGFEVEVLLTEKPATNKFDFTIENASNLVFYYQPPLDAQDIADGVTRPENVVGSYAVYYAKKDYKIGEINYGTGKAFHIYRPRVVDYNGKWTWGELKYSEGVLSVVVPQDFLDTATYPVLVDPTFGKTAIGASRNNLSANQLEVSHFTLSDANITMSKETCYVDKSSGSATGRASVWTDSGAKPLNMVENSASDVAYPASAAWTDYTLSATIAATGEYWLGTKSSATNGGDYFDAGAANSAYFTTGGTYPNPTNPWTDFASSRTRVISCYVTYTTASVGNPGMVHKVIINGAKATFNSLINKAIFP